VGVTANDARKLDHRTLEEIRIRAVRQVQSGQSPEDVIRALGFSRACIYNWIARYRAGGWHALKAKPLAGRPRKLSGEQLRWIYDTVTMRNPLQLQFPFALWTRAMIVTLIWRQWRIRLSKASVGRLLAQMGLSPQRPLYRAFQQNPSLVEKWLQEEFPKLRARAKRKGAEIYFGDEAGVRSDFHAGTTWAPRGKTPIVRATGARFGLNMISAVSAKGLLRFMLVEGRVSATVICEFIQRLMKGATRPVFLILDGHPVHKAAVVRRCVQSFKGKIEVHHLPPYSPELNPDELVWNHVKNHGVGKSPALGPGHLRKKVIGSLRSLQKSPQIVQGFFREKHTAYAA
jgi:transposase